MFQPQSVTTAMPAQVRSRVITGPTPRLTAPAMASAIINPGSALIQQAASAAAGQASGELVASQADARSGGAPFPAIHSLILGFDDIARQNPESATKVIKKGQLIAVYREQSAIRPKTSGAIPKHARGFKAAINTPPPPGVAGAGHVYGVTEMPAYIAIAAEQTTFNCHTLVPVSIVAEHTITLSKDDLQQNIRPEDIIPGAAICIAYNDTKRKCEIRLAADLNERHIPYKSGIITVNDSKDRIQACITADHLVPNVA